MGFKITKDNITNMNNEEEKAWNKKGEEYDYKGGQYRFRLLDDDREIYFYGLSDRENFRPLDWAMNGWGCVIIEYRNEETKQYEML